MNKLIIKISTILLLGFVVISCEKEVGALYEAKDEMRFSFQSTQYKAELVSADGEEIDIAIVRTNTKGAAEVEVSFESSDPIFTLSDPIISFADGEGTAYAKVLFPGADDLGIGTVYKITLKIDADTTALGGNNKSELTLSRKLTWKNWGDGTFTSNDIYGETYPVEIHSPEEAPHIYKAIGLYKDGYDILIYVDKENGTATIPQQEIGLSLFGADYPKTWLRADACTYSNGTITITPGSADNYNKWIVGAAPETLGAFVGEDEVLVLPEGSY